jgi:hypothetical protein
MTEWGKAFQEALAKSDEDQANVAAIGEAGVDL